MLVMGKGGYEPFDWEEELKQADRAKIAAKSAE